MMGNGDCDAYMLILNIHSHSEHIAARLIKNSSIDLLGIVIVSCDNF